MPTEEQIENHKLDSENGFRISYDYRKNGMLSAVSPYDVYTDEETAWKAAQGIANNNPNRNVNVSLVYNKNRDGSTCMPILNSYEKMINKYEPENKGVWNLA